jgi:hypothetical protein
MVSIMIGMIRCMHPPGLTITNVTDSHSAARTTQKASSLKSMTKLFHCDLNPVSTGLNSVSLPKNYYLESLQFP